MSIETTPSPFACTPPGHPTFGQALRFWIQLGFICFGGPAGQIAIRHEELVERRHWVDEEAFLHGLHFCLLLPGPEAQQLAIYCGWLLHRTKGGFAAAVTTWATFAPCFLWVFVGAPYLEQFRRQKRLSAALSTITAAVLGVVLSLAFWFGSHVIIPQPGVFDGFAAVLAVLAFIVMQRCKAGSLPVILARACATIVYRFISAGHHGWVR